MVKVKTVWYLAVWPQDHSICTEASHPHPVLMELSYCIRGYSGDLMLNGIND